jgi:hypothetical protein
MPLLVMLWVTFSSASDNLGNKDGIDPPVACLRVNVCRREQVSCFLSNQSMEETYQLQRALAKYLFANCLPSACAQPSPLLAVPPLITVPLILLISAPGPDCVTFLVLLNA